MQQLNFQGKTKEELAIEFLREHEPRGEPYYLGFSGGKDSTVLLDLAKRAGVKYKAYYSVTGLDAPELMRHIHKHYPDVEWIHPQQHFFKLLVKKGFPTRMRRWCCYELKEAPTKKIPLLHRLMGIRAEESFKRAKRTKIDKMKKWIIYKPIFEWLEYEIWDYISEKGLPVCELYDDPCITRLGCVVCPFLQGRPKQIEIQRNKWPKLFKAFENAMKETYHKCNTSGMIEKRNTMTFDEFLSNWYRGK